MTRDEAKQDAEIWFARAQDSAYRGDFEQSATEALLSQAAAQIAVVATFTDHVVWTRDGGKE